MLESRVSSKSFDLFAAILDRKGYIVGDANANSGLHVLRAEDCSVSSSDTDAGEDCWRQYGWNNVRCFGLDIDCHLPSGSTCFVAGGNGILASTDLVRWRVTSDWRVTEVLDVIVVPEHSGRDRLVVGATAYGPVRSTDDGLSWQAFRNGIDGRSTSSTFCSAVVASADGTRLMVGTEDGIFELELMSNVIDAQWRPAGPRSLAIRCIVEDPFRPQNWFAATDGAGMLILESVPGAEPEYRSELDSTSLYAVACSPLKPGLAATAGFDPALWLTFDSGNTFEAVAAPSRDISVHALAFDPLNSEVLWVGTTDAGVFRLDLLTRKWMFAGLADASVRKLLFVPSDAFSLAG